ncbi:hypothetical protein B296_00021137 [Ensete ventricosum]|uniref:Uncharacterized protein n=1 Tax=Ensete ventricosum TaxID=4639 RepID=A0A426Y6R5_ENSVE|nr:hypothetical protein B296_00021137 [Ensete ventricosum]
MCKLLKTSAGRSGAQVVSLCWSRLLVLDGAVVSRSLLRCSGGSCLSLVEGPCLVGSVGGTFLFTSASFDSSTSSSVIDACTKAVVEEGGVVGVWEVPP